MWAVDSSQSRVQKRELVNGQWTTLADTTLNQMTKVDISHLSVMYQTSVRKQRATGQRNVWWHMACDYIISVLGKLESEAWTT